MFIMFMSHLLISQYKMSATGFYKGFKEITFTTLNMEQNLQK